MKPETEFRLMMAAAVAMFVAWFIFFAATGGLAS